LFISYSPVFAVDSVLFMLRAEIGQYNFYGPALQCTVRAALFKVRNLWKTKIAIVSEISLKDDLDRLI